MNRKYVLDLMRGPVRHMHRIGQDAQHKELRARNEARLAALKAERKLTEEPKQPGYYLDRILTTMDMQS